MKEAIILAGGLGTRLKGVIQNIPKPMAQVANKPFLAYLLDYLVKFQYQRVVLAVGYEHEVIIQYFGNSYKNMDLIYAIENEPLGTGGGIANALNKTLTDHVLILNGDSFFQLNLDEFEKAYHTTYNLLTIAIKPMIEFDRYGTVEVKNDRIIAFNEKQYCAKGLINTGIYIINKLNFFKITWPQKFSFETDFMQKYVENNHFIGYMSDGYFIDIGIPEDYHRAQIEFPLLALQNVI